MILFLIYFSSIRLLLPLSIDNKMKEKNSCPLYIYTHNSQNIFNLQNVFILINPTAIIQNEKIISV